MKLPKWFRTVSVFATAIGALTWGTQTFFNGFNVVVTIANLLPAQSVVITKVIYGIIGISGVGALMTALDDYV